MAPRYIPAVVIFVALVLASAYFYQKESSFIEGMNTTSGTVVALGGKSTSSVETNGQTRSSNTQALVDFTVDGKTWRAEGRALGVPRWAPGEKVDVYYSPDNPETSRIKRWDELYFLTLLCLSFVAFILVFGTINFIVYKKTGRPLS